MTAGTSRHTCHRTRTEIERSPANRGICLSIYGKYGGQCYPCMIESRPLRWPTSNLGAGHSRGMMFHRQASRALKRTLDATVAAVALVAASPAMALTVVAVRLSLGSPVLFKQVRPGLNGEPFTVCKFRTMRHGDGSDAERLTRVGGLLRSTSLDELPQLWNVLIGDMSLVGPRPLLMHYLPLYSERQATRHQVRPGITGLAQVNGRNAISWDDRLELDAQYVEQQSLTLDLRIILRTVRQVLQRSGISADGEATMSAFTGPRTETAA